MLDLPLRVLPKNICQLNILRITLQKAPLMRCGDSRKIKKFVYVGKKHYFCSLIQYI